MATYTDIPAVSAGGGFGTNTILQQPNSAAAQVTTLQLVNDFISNLAGSETAELLMSVPILGTLVQMSLSAANLRGRQTQTTSGTTPSYAWNVRADEFKLTLGADVTTLTVTGLDLATDGGYDIEANLIQAGNQVDLSLSGDAVATLRGGFFGAAYGQFNPATVFFADNVAANVVMSIFASLRETVAGTAKIYRVSMTTSTLWEFYQGTTHATGNVTQVAFGAMKAGTVITLRRVRQTTA